MLSRFEQLELGQNVIRHNFQYSLAKDRSNVVQTI